jgi:dihydroflavonol-4-reductase
MNLLNTSREASAPCARRRGRLPVLGSEGGTRTSVVALTGATGYTGGKLLLALQERGHRVRALARSGAGAAALELNGATVVRGDLRDRASLGRLVEGADAVIHVAAVYRTAGHPDAYYKDVNVGGTEALLEAAARAGVSRFVHTSTVGVHGDIAHPPAEETSPLSPGDVYQASKAEAEALALRFHRERGLPVAVVRPGAIYGPGETRFLKLFRAIARGRYAIVGSGRPYYHPVFIDDLIQGFLLALTRPEAPGEAFIIAGPRYVSQTELAHLIASATGGRVLPFRVPAWPLQWAGTLLEALLAPLGVEPPLHRRRVDFWTKSRAFSTEKARRLLGYAPQVDLEEGFARTAASYREAGWL